MGQKFILQRSAFIIHPCSLAGEGLVRIGVEDREISES
jgi:hypothetical protein